MNEYYAKIYKALTPAFLKANGIVVKQSMSGRIRVRIPRMLHKKQENRWMQSHLNNVEGIIKAESRMAYSGSVIVHFNTNDISARSILALIVCQLSHPETYPDSPEIIPGFENKCELYDCKNKQTFKAKLRSVILLTGVMAHALIRSWIFKLTLGQNPLSFLGIAAIAGTIPLLKEAVEDTVEKKRVTVKPFLTAGSIFTIAMGEAFSAIQILWIYNVAELTEDYVAQRSRQAIRNILEVAPANTYVMVDGMEVEIAVADIRPDDVVAAHTGEKIPVDGIILDGDALVDEASINGRSEAVHRSIGEEVYAGTIISQGTLFIRTVKTGKNTYLSGIMKMVEDSLANKAPAEHKADQLAARLMKIGLTATIATLLFTLDPMRALTVMLVMSCPCATVLAASSALTASLANAARHSILIKGGLYLETVGKTDVYCFDKTGTLTLNTPKIMTIKVKSTDITENQLLSWAATAESHNQHPMARAILGEAKARNLTPKAHAVCEFKAGRGVLCTIGCEDVILVGNRQYMEENQVELSCFDSESAIARAKGCTVVFVARNGSVMGMLGVLNPIRPEAARVLNCLKHDGVKEIHLITGDNKEVAETMMDIFPFNDCRAPLMPEEKARHVRDLNKKSSVVMVGDGVNDALALAQADIGIAIGAGGAEIAIEAADIALADPNLGGLVKVRNLSHQTMKVIDQNHYFAVSTDLLGAALGMLGILSPVMAGMIHIIHTGGILINSGRLLSWEPPDEPMSCLYKNKHHHLECERICCDIDMTTLAS